MLGMSGIDKLPSVMILKLVKTTLSFIPLFMTSKIPSRLTRQKKYDFLKMHYNERQW